MSARGYVPSDVIPVYMWSRGAKVSGHTRTPGVMSTMHAAEPAMRESVRRAAAKRRATAATNARARELAKALPPIDVPQPRQSSCGPLERVEEPAIGWPLTVQRHVQRLGSQRRLAKAIGVDASLVTRWLRDERAPTGERARWLLEATK